MYLMTIKTSVAEPHHFYVPLDPSLIITLYSTLQTYISKEQKSKLHHSSFSILNINGYFKIVKFPIILYFKNEI
jgi:hypothetical protein